MPTIYETLDGATLKIAKTTAELTTAPVDASAQIIGAKVATVANDAQVEATFTSPAQTVALASGATLDVTAYTDWSDPDGWCWFTADNDGETCVFELTLPGGGKMKGDVDVRRADYGGDQSGDPVQFTQSLPARNLTPTKPTGTP